MILEYNLQFFAKEGPGGEKTEQPTAKKKRDSRKEGNVAKSKEIGNCLVLLTLFLVLKVWIGKIGNGLLEVFHASYEKIPELSKTRGGVDEIAISGLLKDVIMNMIIIVGPLFAIAFVVAFVGDYVQVKWAPTTKPLKPKFSKLNPVKGMKKIFSVRSLVELAKSVLKIALIVYIVYTTLKDSIGLIFLVYDMPLMQTIANVGEIVIGVGIKIAAFYIIIAVADYIYEKWKHNEDLKMTKQEVKDEYKNAEGDPQIKGKIRAKMHEASRRRMMQAVPRADVVITNPTHFAVALCYEPDKFDAPYVVAKGEDYLAQKIKEVARENHVEIVENKPLARMLYHNVDIGAQVPPELFQAVAEVLAMVYSMRGTNPPTAKKSSA